MKLSAILLLLLFCVVAHAEEFHKFTAADGSFSGEAALTGIETDKNNNTIVILRRKSDSSLVKVSLSRFTDEDIAWVEERAVVMRVPECMRGRLTPESRAALRKASGSDPAAEAAVESGLQWLSKQQKPDGSWGTTHRAGMTGFALLAMAGQGINEASPRYGDAVRHGATFLVELAGKYAEPFTGVFSTNPPGMFSTYEHAVATQALAEIYALPRPAKNPVPGLKSAIEQAADIIIKKQNPAGAWGYKEGIGYDPYGRNDLSVSCWQIHALCFCREAGIKRPLMPATMKKAALWLGSVQTRAGGFGSPDRTAHYNQWNLSGAALASLCEAAPGAFGFVENRITTNRGLRWMTDQLKAEPLNWTKDCYLYSWYGDSLGMLHAGGDVSKDWYRQCETVLRANQLPDGSWKPETSGPIASAGTSAAGIDKDLYRAALAILMLETPVRYQFKSGK